jgi:hypothetical protein
MVDRAEVRAKLVEMEASAQATAALAVEALALFDQLPDTPVEIPPTVHLLLPLPDATIHPGDLVSIVTEVEVQEPHALGEVRFFIDGTQIGTDAGDPPDFPWVAGPVAAYLVEVEAVDSRGLISERASVTVNVTARPIPDPSITISIPSEGQTVPLVASTGFLCEATVASNVDGDPVARVEWHCDDSGILHTEQDAPPWNWRWNTTAERYTPGAHTLWAEVVTAAGRRARSEDRHVIVGSASPGTITLTGPSAITLPATAPLVAAVSPPTGVTVTRVDFLEGPDLLGSDTTSPYTIDAVLPVGLNQPRAVAILSNGTTLTSAMVDVFVQAEPPDPGDVVFVTEPWPVDIPPEAVVEIGEGLHTLDRDVKVRGRLVATGKGGDARTTIDLRGKRMVWDISTATIDIQATKPGPGGRWSEGPAAFDNGEMCVVAPMARGDMTVRAYHGEPLPQNAMGRQAEVLNQWADVVFTDTTTAGGGDVHISSGPNHDSPRLVPGPAITFKWGRMERLGTPRGFKPGTLNLFQNRNPENGEYPLHFHECADASRGSIVEGVLIRQSRHHGFVPHASHGVTIDGCAVFDSAAEAYWWDPKTKTNDLHYKNCLALKIGPELPLDRFGGYRHSAFWMAGSGPGHNIQATGCHAAVVWGGPQHSGFHWPEHDHGVWEPFVDCVAHNIAGAGLFGWQNDSFLHDITDFDAWACGTYGVDHGAYTNCYRYNGIRTADCGIAGFGLHAMTGGPRDCEINDHTHFGPGVPFQLIKATALVMGISDRPVVVRRQSWAPTAPPITFRHDDASAGTIAQRLRFAA